MTSQEHQLKMLISPKRNWMKVQFDLTLNLIQAHLQELHEKSQVQNPSLLQSKWNLTLEDCMDFEESKDNLFETTMNLNLRLKRALYFQDLQIMLLKSFHLSLSSMTKKNCVNLDLILFDSKMLIKKSTFLDQAHMKIRFKFQNWNRRGLRCFWKNDKLRKYFHLRLVQALFLIQNNMSMSLRRTQLKLLLLLIQDSLLYLPLFKIQDQDNTFLLKISSNLKELVLNVQVNETQTRCF